MPEVIETTIFQFDELSDSAKERARDWYREASAGDSFHLESSVEDFAQICDKFGITLDTQAVKLMGGGTRYDPAVSYSVGYCQSDFAAFDGRYAYVKGAAKAVRDYAPQDAELHRIADALQAVQAKNFYTLTAVVKYHHYYGLQVEVDTTTGREVPDSAFEEIKEAMRDLARWLYDSLRKEDEYQSSEEVVDENIRANEYTFTEDGERFG